MKWSPGRAAQGKQCWIRQVRFLSLLSHFLLPPTSCPRPHCFSGSRHGRPVRGAVCELVLSFSREGSQPEAQVRAPQRADLPFGPAAVLQRGEVSRNWLSESAPLLYCHCVGPFLPRGETCTEIGLVFCKSLLHTHTFSLGPERACAPRLNTIRFGFPSS